MRSRWSGRTKTTLLALARTGAVAAGLALAGCQTDGAPFAETATGSPVAFEQIDGLPRATFDQFVTRLGPAADTHKVYVVSRTTDAPYRVKGYLSLQKDGGKTSLAYAWDVFDRDGARVTRLSGAEPLAIPRGASDPWTACDQEVLDKVADRTMADLAETLSGGAAVASASPARAAPQTSGPVQPARAAALAFPSATDSPSALSYAPR